MHLIGIACQSRESRSTIARILCECHGFVEVVLANPMLEPIASTIGLSPDEISEWARDRINPDIWIRFAELQINRIREVGPSQHVSGIVVSNLRFENETKWIRTQHGKVWHVLKNPDGDVIPADRLDLEWRHYLPVWCGDSYLYDLNEEVLHEEIEELLDGLEPQQPHFLED